MTDRYQILEQLGEGGSGSVYKAWDAKLQRHVAIKFLLPQQQRTSEQGTNLAREAAAIAGLQHPNVVSVFDLDTEGLEPMVVMEFINGETLEQSARRGPMAQEDWEKIAQEGLDGLAAAHAAGMVHRDIKPGNMMFQWLTNESYQIKLLDFGLANQGMRPEHQQKSAEGTVAGSVHFMAPEQFLHHPLDVRTDLYSMGAVLFYTLSGALPFDGETTEEVMNAHLKHSHPPLTTLRPDVPPLLAEWVEWLIKRQPSDRPESAPTALKVLRGIISGSITQIPGRRTTAIKTVSEPPREIGAKNIKAVADDGNDDDAGPSKKPWLIAAALIALGGILWAVKNKTTPPTPANTAPPAEAPAPALARNPAPVTSKAPPAAAPARTTTPESSPSVSDPIPGLPGLPLNSLIVCLDAAAGAKMKRGTQPAVAGEPADYWPDLASAVGDNGAQSYKTGNPSGAEDHVPIWGPVAAGGGLNEKEMTFSFATERNFVLARDNDKVGAPVGETFSGNGITWMLVFMAPAETAEDQVLIQARVEKEHRGWETRITGDSIISGGRNKAAERQYHSKSPFKPGAWILLAARHDGQARSIQQWMVTSDGKLQTGDPEPAALVTGETEYIRLGSGKSSSEPTTREYFQGSLACVLIYNSALSDAEIKTSLGALSQRFFTKALVE